jgi:hypothetical protein
MTDKVFLLCQELLLQDESGQVCRVHESDLNDLLWKVGVCFRIFKQAV